MKEHVYAKYEMSEQYELFKYKKEEFQFIW